MHPRLNEKGGFLVEGVLAVMAMALVFLALVQLGDLAVDRMHRQSEASHRLWYAVTGTHWTETDVRWHVQGQGPMVHVEEDRQVAEGGTEGDSAGARSIRVGVRRSR